MKSIAHNFLKIISRVLIVFILLVSFFTVVNEKNSSKSLIVNWSKRIVAEGGWFLAKIFPQDAGSGSHLFGPRDSRNLIPVLLKQELNSGALKIIAVKDYALSASAKNFQYEDLTDKKLKFLREKYALQELISNTPDEWSRIILLRDWVKKKIPIGAPKNVDYNFDAVDILSRSENGQTFFCSEYSTVFVQCALSIGLIARYVGLFKGHVVAEIWSNEFGKWVVLDVANNLHYEKNNIPLSAIELHEAWEYKNLSNIKALQGIERKTLRDEEMQKYISFYHEFYVRMRNDWFSHKYPHWHPRGNSIMNGLEWQDEFTRNNILVAKETRRKDDLYFSLNCTSINLADYDTSSGDLRVTFGTFTPNFQYFDIVAGGREFRLSKSNFIWHLSQGRNRLEVHSVNSLGVKGCKSFIEVERL